MSLKEWIEVSQLVVNLAVVGAVPFIVWLIIKAFKEQQEALRLKNEYFDAISVKNWREQKDALRLEYEDRIKRIAHELSRRFAQDVTAIVQEIRVEDSVTRVKRMLEKRAEDPGGRESLMNDISNEIIYSGDPVAVLRKMPPAIAEELKKGTSLLSLHLLLQNTMKNQHSR